VKFPPEETRRIREAVFRRADGICECGCGQWLNDNGHMDHAESRRVQQTERNCWALTLECDLMRTVNSPSAAAWLRKFIAHCERHGYAAEAERAGARLLVLKAKGRA
jgi:hypothetical protein